MPRKKTNRDWVFLRRLDVGDRFKFMTGRKVYVVIFYLGDVMGYKDLSANKEYYLSFAQAGSLMVVPIGT